MKRSGRNDRATYPYLGILWQLTFIMRSKNTANIASGHFSPSLVEEVFCTGAIFTEFREIEGKNEGKEGKSPASARHYLLWSKKREQTRGRPHWQGRTFSRQIHFRPDSARDSPQSYKPPPDALPGQNPHP